MITVTQVQTGTQEMHEVMGNVINDVVLRPEVETAWEVICQHVAQNEKERFLKIFEGGHIPPMKADVLPDGTLFVYADGKDGKIVMNVPIEGWQYRVLH